MFGGNPAFSSYSVGDTDDVRGFYADTLGLAVEDKWGALMLTLSNGHQVMAYPKGPDHVPATFTVLNFLVDDVEATVDALVAKGVRFEIYPNTNSKGIQVQDGPPMAWFKDPAGNIISVVTTDSSAAA